MARAEAMIDALHATAYKIPTDRPEADGTLEWNSTTMVVAEVRAAGIQGLGYTYSSSAIVPLIRETLATAVRGRDGFDIPGCWMALQRSVRNLGREGLAATAISAVDLALWDLKAKLLQLPLARLLGQCRSVVPIYGSGGFTTYDDDDLCDQLQGWVENEGCRWVKMKIGAHPDDDARRVALARQAIGDCGLFVDANGAYSSKQALRLSQAFADEHVSWFEEPLSSDDLAGLAKLRARLPAGMDLAAGEYGYTADYFRQMLGAGAVDVLQADVTRCGGITGFLAAAALCEPFHTDLSSHCAPSAHLAVACAVPRLRHLEWFHDHVRIEHHLFDGAPVPREGLLRPDPSRPGLGIEFKRADAQRYEIS